VSPIVDDSTDAVYGKVQKYLTDTREIICKKVDEVTFEKQSEITSSLQIRQQFNHPNIIKLYRFVYDINNNLFSSNKLKLNRFYEYWDHNLLREI
jgi:hypothetical protein